MADIAAIHSRVLGWRDFVKGRFWRLTLREQILLLLFAGALLAIWLSSQIDRHSRVWADIAAANQEARSQGIWISERDTIEGQFQEAIAAIDLEELPSRDEVNARIDSLVRKYNFADFRMDPPRSDYGIPLSFHTFSLNLRQAEYQNLIDFTEDLKASFPYVSLRRIVIQAQRSNPHLLDVRLQLKSIEYTP